MRARKVGILAVLLAAAGVAAVVVFARPGHAPGQVAPRVTAARETAMWKAYYARQRLTLFRLLVVQMREENAVSWATATRQAFHLARAAARFAEMREGYDRVLPDLTRAFASAREATGASYEPTQVARAELDWWVARRTPGIDSAEHVGALIAQEYALYYDRPVARMLEAGRLRAEAAALRDAGGVQADWPRVEQLLVESYVALQDARR